MGFLDFFRKRSKGKKEIEIKRIKFNELQSWLQTKKTEIKEQEENFLKVIQVRISQLIQELKEKISILRKINVEEKKVEEKIKIIVRENLDYYIYYLDELINKLKETNENPEKEIVEKINSIFSDFGRRSRMSFEKATFLIGEELGVVNETINAFFKDVENVLKDNKDLIDESKIISSTETKIEKFSNVKRIKSEIEKTINEYNKEINNLKNSIEIQEKEIEKIKKSEKFIEQEKKKEELKKKKEELSEEIYNLKEITDFKSLANFFHSFEKEMNMIKAHKENFKEVFQKTNGAELVSLLQGAKLPDLKVLNKIQDIAEKEREINNIVINKIGIEDLETEIEKTKSEIEALNSKKVIERKKSEKQEKNLNEILNLVKEELIKINVEVAWQGHSIMETTKSAGGIIKHNGKLCLAFQNESQWVIPKGRIERDESEVAAAIREVIEETGYKNLKLIKELGEINRKSFHSKMDKNIKLFLFELIDEESQPIEEGHSVGWFDFQEAVDKLYFKEERDFLLEQEELFTS